MIHNKPHTTLRTIILASVMALLVASVCDGRRRRPRRPRMVDPSTVPSIVIDKRNMTLSLISTDGDTMLHTGVATGLRPGQKRRPGDMRTPEGDFRVVEIVDASKWKHDFGDGLGEIDGAYGPWFIRLLTPGHTGIGIHGTHLPSSIGTRASEGCIRLLNDSLLRLVPHVKPGAAVTIIPALDDRLVSLTDRDSIYIASDTVAIYGEDPLRPKPVEVLCDSVI